MAMFKILSAKLAGTPPNPFKNAVASSIGVPLASFLAEGQK
jgi:hypothetical protein